MTTKQFIEKAIEGGWDIDGIDVSDYVLEEDGSFFFNIDTKNNDGIRSHLGLILLDPKAWQAVGKVEGWGIETVYSLPKDTFRLYGVCGTRQEPSVDVVQKTYIRKMHRMIDALAEGKSVEEYLKTL